LVTSWQVPQKAEVFRAGLPVADAQEARARWAVRSQDRNRVNGMLEMAAPHLARRPDDLDADPWQLNVLNGTLDLRTGELRPHRREDLITKLGPVKYEPGAQCPTFQQFLEDIFGANPDADPDGSAAHDLIAFLQRAVGYSLTGVVREHVMFILWGGGRNGKSTLLDVLGFILGDYAMGTPADTFLAKDRGSGSIPNDIARLKAARLVTASETRSGKRLDEALIKQTTGGDRVTARFLRREFFEFKPQFKLWLATNNRPDVRGVDRAIWSRILLLPFTQTFYRPDEDRPARAKIIDPMMGERLRREAPGILRWSVEGCIKWQREGLSPPAVVRAAVDDYRRDQDVVGEFIDARCRLGPDLRERAAALFGSYTKWAAANAAPELTPQAFGRRLGEHGLKRVRAGDRFWQGVELKAEFKVAP